MCPENACSTNYADGVNGEKGHRRGEIARPREHKSISFNKSSNLLSIPLRLPRLNVSGGMNVFIRFRLACVMSRAASDLDACVGIPSVQIQPCRKRIRTSSALKDCVNLFRCNHSFVVKSNVIRKRIL